VDFRFALTENAPYYRWAVMTGGSKRDGLVCARMLSDMVAWPKEFSRTRENKYAKAPGTFCGLLFLFSARDATPVAMINDGVLQHLRVGGGAGLGVKYLSRRDSETVGMIGLAEWFARISMRSVRCGKSRKSKSTVPIERMSRGTRRRSQNGTALR
jgi:alanine dehydrogenase